MSTPLDRLINTTPYPGQVYFVPLIRVSWCIYSWHYSVHHRLNLWKCDQIIKDWQQSLTQYNFLTCSRCQWAITLFNHTPLQMPINDVQGGAFGMFSEGVSWWFSRFRWTSLYTGFQIHYFCINARIRFWSYFSLHNILHACQSCICMQFR